MQFVFLSIIEVFCLSKKIAKNHVSIIIIFLIFNKCTALIEPVKEYPHNLFTFALVYTQMLVTHWGVEETYPPMTMGKKLSVS